MKMVWLPYQEKNKIVYIKQEQKNEESTVQIIQVFMYTFIIKKT